MTKQTNLYYQTGYEQGRLDQRERIEEAIDEINSLDLNDFCRGELKRKVVQIIRKHMR